MSRGTSNTQSEGFQYLSFMAGKFVKRVPEGTKGSEARELKKGPKAGTMVHEIKYDTIGGQIIDIKTEAHDQYGMQLHVFLDVSTVEEPDAKIKLSMSMSSGPAKGLLSRLPVIDFAKDVVLKGYHIEKKDQPGKFGTYLVPYQDDQKLASYYTKEEPKGMPQMVQIKVKGNLVWDDSEQIEFLEALINSTEFPGDNTQSEPTTMPEEPTTTDDSGVEDDDLPF